MKYILVLADGMADEPIDALEGRTPLEAADTPTFDGLSSKGEVGLLNTIPTGMKPGSDTANLSVLGYDPLRYYTGRSPLEAISIGARMEESDVCFRINFVTLSEEGPYESKIIEDHSADEITTHEAAELLKSIQEHFQSEGRTFYKGVSYRHAMIMANGSTKVELTPPHNILGQSITNYLPKGDFAEMFEGMMRESYAILNHHPINEERRKKGLRPANSIWPWGEGTKPILPSFESMFGVKGAMISAVDLLKGIAISAGMRSIDVEGATGNLHTNYEGKMKAALETLNNGDDFVYIHIEAPDECGHRGELENKIKAIEYIDDRVVKPIVEYMEKNHMDYKLAVLPDHPTPLSIRTHTSNPVPYFIYSSNMPTEQVYGYSEKEAKESGRLIEHGYEFMTYFLS